VTAPTPNAELAYRVWDHILANPDQHASDVWIYRGDPECGTAACVAGWACLLSGDEPVYTFADEDEANTVEFDGNTDRVARRAAALLGIECDEDDVYGHPLFHVGNSVTVIGRLVAEIFGPRPTSYGTGCRCTYLGEGTPEHTPSALCLPGGES
jgi:hypothetical protein